MATGSKGRPNSKSSGGFSNYSADNSVDVGNDHKSDSLAFLLIAILLVIVLVFLPLMAWMYVDVRQMEIRVDKTLKRLEK